VSVTWPAEPVALDAAAIAKAYDAVRPELAKDPLFMTDADDFGVSLDVLDARMKQPPKQVAGSSDEFYAWLDGADQVRYAGLHVLLRAMGGGEPLDLRGHVVVGEGTTRIARGDVHIAGNLELEPQAIVVVLGKLTIDGVLLGDVFDYSLVAAREIECRGGVTGGELIATDRIVARGPFYFAGNDYSSRAPRYEGDLLVDFERGNAFTEVAVKQRVSDWDFAKAAKALGVSADDELARAFRAKLLG
jgi:hypothetical protein